MVRITEALVRSRAEHNEGIINNLEEVTLHQFEIEKIEFLNQHCRKLKIIYLQNNIISKIENLSRLFDLEYLNLALNNIKVIENLEKCESLKKLDLTVNFIDVRTLLPSIEHLTSCYNLKELYLTGNPCTKFEGYRKLVIAMLPSLVSLDGEDITPTERIESKQNLHGIIKLLKQEIADLPEEKENPETYSCSETSAYTPENRLKMYREIAEEKSQKEEAKKKQSSSLMSEMPDPLKEAKKKMSEKATESSDGSLPRQRNQGQWEFSISEDGKGNIVVDIAVEKYLSTSLIDVDVHPLWFQCKMKDLLLLLHLPEEVKSDSVKVQRIQANGHLVLIMPKVAIQNDKIGQSQGQILSCNGPKAKKSFESLKPLNENFRNISKSNSFGDEMVSRTTKSSVEVDESDVPPLEYCTFNK